LNERIGSAFSACSHFHDNRDQAALTNVPFVPLACGRNLRFPLQAAPTSAASPTQLYRLTGKGLKELRACQHRGADEAIHPTGHDQGARQQLQQYNERNTGNR
jgi:hypothetical protein